MKHLFSFILFLLLAVSLHSQDWASQYRFQDADAVLAAQPIKTRVVLMGDSITDLWQIRDAEFFRKNGLIMRGFSGQTTSQMLLRFREDVVCAGASTVVILAGTNDIAGNTGYCTPEMILNNISSMCDIARSNGIRPVICSLLPAHSFPWTKDERCNPVQRIPQTNALLKEYAQKNRITYVDYFTALVDRENPDNVNGLPAAYSSDGVHPNKECYAIMEDVLAAALKKEFAAYKRPEGLLMMSYNIRNGLGMDKKRAHNRPAAIIADAHPDVVAVQEIDCGTKRSNGADVIKVLSKYTGMVPTFAKAIDYDGGEYGVGILSVCDPIRTKTVPLPGREESRVLLITEFEDYIFCCTHLSLTREDRLTSVQIIDDALKEFTSGCLKPVYIAGDWNATPESETLQKIKEHFIILSDTDSYTFPSTAPDRTIDYIALWKGNNPSTNMKPSLVRTLCSSVASDHRPVVVQLSID